MERNDENRQLWEEQPQEEVSDWNQLAQEAARKEQQPYQGPYQGQPYRQPYQGQPYQQPYEGQPYQGQQYRQTAQRETYQREEVSDPNLVVRTNTERQKSRKSGNVVLAAVIGFLAAALIALMIFAVVFHNRKEDNGDETRKARETTVAPTGGEKETETKSPWGSSDEKVVSDDLEEKLEEIRDRLDEYYLFEDEAGDTDFDTAMIRAYVDALGDPYTYYYTKDELQQLFEDDSGTYSGVGVLIQQDPETMAITILNVFKGSPAEEAGLKVGDILYKIGDRECGQTDINVVVTWVRGETGTTVEITVYRPSVNDYVTVTSRRETIETPTVEYEMLDGNVGYISLSQFIETTANSFKKAYQELESEGMKYLIIDLRNNGGGLVSSVTDIADYLLPKGTITYLIDKDGKREDYNSDKFSALNIPCVVLVNGNTASASEILTGALSDYQLATVVGETTFGKGIVQVILTLSDGTGLKVTMARYYTPNGVCIHGEGIAPDVETKDDASTDQDEQLQKAIEVVKSLK